MWTVNFQMFRLVLERQRNQISNCQHLLDHRKSKRVPEKHLFCVIDYAKVFDYVDHNKLWKILCFLNCGKFLKRWEYQTIWPVCRSGRTVRTGHGTIDWFQIGKGVRQGCILSPCLFNFCAEYIMRNTGLEEAQAGIKIVGRNISKLDMQMTPPLWQKVKKI